MKRCRTMLSCILAVAISMTSFTVPTLAAKEESMTGEMVVEESTELESVEAESESDIFDEAMMAEGTKDNMEASAETAEDDAGAMKKSLELYGEVTYTLSDNKVIQPRDVYCDELTVKGKGKLTFDISKVEDGYAYLWEVNVEEGATLEILTVDYDVSLEIGKVNNKGKIIFNGGDVSVEDTILTYPGASLPVVKKNTKIVAYDGILFTEYNDTYGNYIYEDVTRSGVCVTSIGYDGHAYSYGEDLEYIADEDKHYVLSVSDNDTLDLASSLKDYGISNNNALNIKYEVEGSCVKVSANGIVTPVKAGATMVKMIITPKGAKYFFTNTSSIVIKNFIEVRDEANEEISANNINIKFLGSLDNFNPYSKYSACIEFTWDFMKPANGAKAYSGNHEWSLKSVSVDDEVFNKYFVINTDDGDTEYNSYISSLYLLTRDADGNGVADFEDDKKTPEFTNLKLKFRFSGDGNYYVKEHVVPSVKFRYEKPEIIAKGALTLNNFYKASPEQSEFVAYKAGKTTRYQVDSPADHVQYKNKNMYFSPSDFTLVGIKGSASANFVCESFNDRTVYRTKQLLEYKPSGTAKETVTCEFKLDDFYGIYPVDLNVNVVEKAPKLKALPFKGALTGKYQYKSVVCASDKKPSMSIFESVSSACIKNDDRFDSAENQLRNGSGYTESTSKMVQNDAIYFYATTKDRKLTLSGNSTVDISIVFKNQRDASKPIVVKQKLTDETPKVKPQKLFGYINRTDGGDKKLAVSGNYAFSMGFLGDTDKTITKYELKVLAEKDNVPGNAPKELGLSDSYGKAVNTVSASRVEIGGGRNSFGKDATSSEIGFGLNPKKEAAGKTYTLLNRATVKEKDGTSLTFTLAYVTIKVEEASFAAGKSVKLKIDLNQPMGVAYDEYYGITATYSKQKNVFDPKLSGYVENDKFNICRRKTKMTKEEMEDSAVHGNYLFYDCDNPYITLMYVRDYLYEEADGDYVPGLKLIADVAPEAIRSGAVKAGDVAKIKITYVDGVSLATAEQVVDITFTASKPKYIICDYDGYYVGNESAFVLYKDAPYSEALARLNLSCPTIYDKNYVLNAYNDYYEEYDGSEDYETERGYYDEDERCPIGSVIDTTSLNVANAKMADIFAVRFDKTGKIRVGFKNLASVEKVDHNKKYSVPVEFKLNTLEKPVVTKLTVYVR